MKKLISIKTALISTAICLGCAAWSAEEQISAWDKGQQEISGNPACPIEYPKVFMRERDIMKYNPRFLPGQLTFNDDNRPVIRVGLMKADAIGRNGQTAPIRDMGEINLIQYLGKDGRWYSTDGHVKAVRNLLKLSDSDPLTIQFGERTNDSVEFDGQGGAYTLLNTNRGCFLVWSPDEFKTFKAIGFKGGAQVRLEPFRYHIGANRVIRLLVVESGNVYMRYVEIKNGRPSMSKPILLVARDKKPGVQVNSAAGAGPAMLTAGGKTFLTYMGQIPVEGQSGSPHYIVEYDHATGKVSEPVFLGTTGDKIDFHNLPVLDLDSKGYLHVIGGSHWHPFKHWISKKPYSVLSGWTDPEIIPAGSPNKYSHNGFSYPGFMIDKDDTLHIVARGRNAKRIAEDPSEISNKHLNYALVYLRRKPDGQWESRKDLTITPWRHYANWYQKVTPDRNGNAYCTYFYFAIRLDLDKEVYDDYCRRWPEETLRGGQENTWDVKAHDPVIIGSFDNGDVWKVVTTTDFIANSKQEK